MDGRDTGRWVGSIRGWKHLSGPEEGGTNKWMAKWGVKNEHSELQEPLGSSDGGRGMRHLLGERRSLLLWTQGWGGQGWNGKIRCQIPGGWSTRPSGGAKVSSWWRKENEA